MKRNKIVAVEKSEKSSRRPSGSRRRTFTAEYKHRILTEVDACKHGQAKLLMRREALCGSHLQMWRRQRKAGELAGLIPKARGRKPQKKDLLLREVEYLRRRAEQLEKRLRQVEAILSLQSSQWRLAQSHRALTKSLTVLPRM